MSSYVFSYRSPGSYSPSQESLAEWMKWFGGMGDQLIDLGKPASVRAQVGDCDPGRTELGGYSVIEAADIEAAKAIAKGCPYVTRGGGVEIGQLADVPTAETLAG